jgi:hypothetical protein
MYPGMPMPQMGMMGPSGMPMGLPPNHPMFFVRPMSGPMGPMGQMGQMVMMPPGAVMVGPGGMMPPMGSPGGRPMMVPQVRRCRRWEGRGAGEDDVQRPLQQFQLNFECAAVCLLSFELLKPLLRWLACFLC